MSYAIVLPDTFTAGEIAYRDEVLNPGSLFCFDFADVYCWDPATMAIADLAVVKNLVDGAPNGTLRVAGGKTAFAANKGFQFNTTANDNYFQIGQGTDYFQSNLAHDFLLIAWIIRPAGDPSSTGGFILSKMTTGDNSGAGIYLSWSNGYATTLRYDAKFSANTPANADAQNTNVAAAGTAAGLHQVAMARIGNNLSVFRNGSLVGSATAIPSGTALAANSNPFYFGGRPGSAFTSINGLIVCRALGEDLTISGKLAADQVAADYAANSARFV